MAVFVKMSYLNTKSWYRILIKRYYGVFEIECFPIPRDGILLLENIRGGRLDNIYDMEQLDCVEANDFDELDWSNTILDESNASHGWLATDGRFWGHEYGLIDEAARFALRNYALKLLGDEAETKYVGCFYAAQEQLWDTGAVYIHSKNLKGRYYSKNREVPLSDAQRKWLVDNNFEIKKGD